MLCLMFLPPSQEGVEVRVARIFNTFGSRMHMNDGRVVSNFILQALQGEPLTVRTLRFRFLFPPAVFISRLLAGWGWDQCRVFIDAPLTCALIGVVAPRRNPHLRALVFDFNTSCAASARCWFASYSRVLK